MEPLKIAAGFHTPSVTFDPEAGVFELAGKSLPEDVIEFYTPVLDWLDQYKDNPNPESHFVFRLEYFNTGSSKMLLDMMLRLQAMVSDTHDLRITWYYLEEDEAMLEAGEEYEEILLVPFELKQGK